MWRRCTVGLVGLIAIAAVVMLASSGIVAREQAQTGDLAALTTEVHQLRVAVEDASRAQTQTQALAVYLSAEQSRLVQSANRLDAVRRDLDAAAIKVRGLTADLGDAERALARATEFRPEFEGRVAGLKRELALATDAEQRLRARETTALEVTQQDEATWRDLVARLELAIKR